jgi:hypothetical protein
MHPYPFLGVFVSLCLLGGEGCGLPEGTVTQKHAGTLVESDTRYEGGLSDRYTVAARSGDKLIIQMRSLDIDSFLVLMDSSERVLETNEYISLKHRNAQIMFYAPKDDTYVVIATQGKGGGTGSYDVEIDVIPRESL